MAKKIIYLCPNGYLGGAERFVLDACLAHMKEGRYTPIIIFFSDGEAVQQAKKLGIIHYTLKAKFKLSQPLQLLGAARELRCLLRRFNAKVYHATMPYAHIVGSLATMGLGFKKTWYQHGPVGGTLDLLATFFKVDYLFFNSSYTRDLHHRTISFQAPRRGERVISPAIVEKKVDLDISHDLRARLKRGNGILFMCAGRISPFKNIETIIHAFSVVKKKYPASQLLIAGDITQEKDQTYMDSLREEVKELEMDSSVHFLGQKRDIQNYYHACDVFVHFPNGPEPFGLVVTEAMLYENLIVARGDGGAADYLFNEVNALTIEVTQQNDVRSLIKGMSKAAFLYANSTEFVHKLQQNALLTIRKNYDLKNLAMSLEYAYDH